MASSASTPLRTALEQRLSQLSIEMEGLFGEARERARREMADQLNQAARRIRRADGIAEIGATLLDAAAGFAGGCTLFRLEEGIAKGGNVRGVPDTAAESFAKLEVSLASAAALAGAVDSRDLVVAAATPAEVSQELIDLVGHATDERVSIFPLVVRDQVAALLYAWGAVQGSAVELLAQIAASVWSAVPVAAPAGLVAIAAPAPAPVAVPVPISPEPPAQDAGSAWDRLSSEEQQIHLRAQRFARVQAAEMRLQEPDAVRSGRARKNLYQALDKRIDEAREKFRRTFFAGCPSMVDYLHLELIRTLANDDAELLGNDYPGPMV